MGLYDDEDAGQTDVLSRGLVRKRTGGLSYPTRYPSLAAGKGAAANSFVGGFFEGRKERRAQERFDQDSELRAGQIEGIKKDRAYQAMKRDMRAALGEFLGTGGANTIPLRDAYNTHNPGQNNSLVDAIEPTEDGGYDMRFADGRAVKFKDMDELGMKFTAITDPAAYLTAMQKSKDIKQDVGKQLELHEGKLKLDRQYGLRAGRPDKPTAPKPTRYPNHRAVQDAQDMLADDPELSLLSKEERRLLSFKAAARATKLLQGGEMDAADALSQAIDEERRNIRPGEKRSLLGIDVLMPDKKPTYRGFREQDQGQEIPRIAGDEDYHQLPSGTQFLAPDGKVRIKP